MKFSYLFFEEYKDQFNNYNLIKKIKNGYRLYFNKKKKNFAIVNINNNFEICFEFNNYFRNIRNDLRFSLIENINKVVKNIETNNEILEKTKLKSTKQATEFCLNETLNLTKRFSKINNNDIKTIIGANKC